MYQERLILALPHGFLEAGSSRHLDVSGLAAQTRRFLQLGCGFEPEEWPTGQSYHFVRRFPLEFAELEDSDIPKTVARRGDEVQKEGLRIIHLGITEEHYVLNLPEEDLQHIKILRRLGFGYCDLTLGVPKGSAFSQDSKLEDVAGLRVATSLPVLTERIFKERGVNVTIVERDGHVENAIRYGLADVMVDTTEDNNMRVNRIIPAERLKSLETVLIGSTYPLDEGAERVLNSLLKRMDKALENPRTWLELKSAISESQHRDIKSLSISAIGSIIGRLFSKPQVPVG